MAVDRPAVIRTVLGGLGVVPPGPVSPMEWIWSDRDPRAQVDTAEASRTLDRLGWTKRGPDGIRTKQGRRLSFSVIFPSFSQIRLRTGEVIQDQLKRVGVDMQLQPLEGNIWADRANRGRFDALLGSWQTDPTPASVLQTWTSSGIGGYNFQRYSNPAYDALVQRAVQSRDRTAATALWHEANDAINADAPAAWIFAPTTLGAVSSRFTNVTFQADQWAMNMWQWRVAPGSVTATSTPPSR
jgi:peptide/nickel transport system substrate-binding protein